MSSTDTDSTADIMSFARHLHPLRSRLYTGRSLPTYQKFLNQLQELDTGSLTPGSYCPICHIPFSESHARSSNGRSEYRHVLSLEVLPFYFDESHAQIDKPVRVPCASQHIVGKACIMNWATEGGGTTCLLDREELFVFGPEETPTVTDDEHRFNSGLRDIEKLPIRHLLQRFRTATETDIVTVNARSMTKRLATLIFRVIFQWTGVPEAFTARWKWPRIRRALYEYNEATAFRNLVRHFMESEPLPESGQYPRHVVALLNPALPHVFALLYRVARFFAAKSIPLDLLAYDMHEHLHGFFSDFAYLITDTQMLQSITYKVIDVWATQEFLVTELRTATNQPNEWDDMVGPSDSETERRRPVRPYFSISGPVGLLGYQYVPYDRDRDRALWDVPLTLSEAAELLRYDDVYSPRRSRITGTMDASRSAEPISLGGFDD
jgi:hypothetical protein